MELDVFDRWLAGDRTPPVDEPGFRVGLVTPEGAIMSGIRLALGKGLFTAEHDRWKVQRRLMQPMEPPEDHQDREGRPVPKR